MGAENDSILNLDEVVDQRVLYLPEYRVLICRSCELSIRPGDGIKRHLMDFHLTWPLSLRKSIAVYASQLRLAPLQDVTPPDRQSPPIRELKVYDGYYYCTYTYLCGTEKSMQEHCKRDHA